MKRISVDKCNSIIPKLQIGLSSRKISYQLRISHTTVNNIRKKYLPEQQKSQGSHPKKPSPNNECKIIRSITSGKVDTAVKFWQQLFRDTRKILYSETIRNVLKKKGLKSLIKPKNLCLS
jgi:transposase